MAVFRLYFLDPSNRILRVVRLECDDESTAREHALQATGDRTVELWRGLVRLVRHRRTREPAPRPYRKRRPPRGQPLPASTGR